MESENERNNPRFPLRHLSRSDGDGPLGSGLAPIPLHHAISEDHAPDGRYMTLCTARYSPRFRHVVKGCGDLIPGREMLDGTIRWFCTNDSCGLYLLTIRQIKRQSKEKWSYEDQKIWFDGT